MKGIRKVESGERCFFSEGSTEEGGIVCASGRDSVIFGNLGGVGGEFTTNLAV